MPLTSEPARASSVRCTERSAPSDTALWSARTAVSGPMVTAMTSSTSIEPPSFSCMAASMACVSKGFRFFSPERLRRPVEGSMRFSTAASGTSLTRTQIFTGSGPPVTERAFASYSDGCPIDLSVNQSGRSLRRRVSSASTVTKPRQSASWAGDQAGKLKVQPPSWLLTGGEVIEVRGDGRRRRTAGARSSPGRGAKPSGPWTSPVASGSSVTTSRSGRLHVLERVGGALAVGHVIEEAQRAVEVVWAGRSERRDALPHQLGRPVHPFVARAAGRAASRGSGRC